MTDRRSVAAGVAQMIRAKKADSRRAEIVEAASGLFSEKGYEDTTVTDIVNSVGIAKGTFYHHFQSKEDLFWEVVSTRFEDVLATGLEIVERVDVGALDKLLMIVDRLFMRMGNSWIGWLPEILNGDSASPRILHEEGGLKPIVLSDRLLWPIVQQGVDEGVFGTPYPKDSAFLWLQLMVSIGIRRTPEDEARGILVHLTSRLLEADENEMDEFNSRLIELTNKDYGVVR